MGVGTETTGRSASRTDGSPIRKVPDGCVPRNLRRRHRGRPADRLTVLSTPSGPGIDDPAPRDSPMPRMLAAVALLCVPVAAAFVGAQEPVATGSNPPPPVQMTKEQDHRRMMDLLGIRSLRPGPSGNPNAPQRGQHRRVEGQSLSRPPRPADVEGRREGHDARAVVEPAAAPRSSRTSTARSTAASRTRRPR